MRGGKHGSNTARPAGEAPTTGHSGRGAPSPANLRPSRGSSQPGRAAGARLRGGRAPQGVRRRPCPTRRSPFVLAAASHGGVPCAVPLRPSVGPPFPRRPGQLQPANGARANPLGRTGHSRTEPGALHGVTCKEKEPAPHLPPGCKTVPPGEPAPAERPRGRGRDGFASGKHPQSPIGCLAAPPLLLPAPPGQLRAPIGGGGGDARQAGLRKRSEAIT